VQIPDEIIDALLDAHTCAPQVDSWIVLKRMLLNSVPSNIRRLFSTRHALTKRTWTNEMELELARRWSELTGRPVLFKDDEGPTRIEAAP
jgi:hypothetical protein